MCSISSCTHEQQVLTLSSCQVMSIEIQKQIKDNATSVSDFFSDLYKWTEDQVKEERRREIRKTARQVGIDEAQKLIAAKPAERDAAEQINDAHADGERSDPIKRDNAPIAQYYHDWDRYDPEAEVGRIEEEAFQSQRAEMDARQAEKDRILDEMALKPNGDRTRTSAAKPRVKVSVRRSGRKVAPVDLAAPRKDEANRLFGAGRYREAIAAYTAAIDCLDKYQPSEAGYNPGDRVHEDGAGEKEAIALKVALLANRALACLKLELDLYLLMMRFLKPMANGSNRPAALELTLTHHLSNLLDVEVAFLPTLLVAEAQNTFCTPENLGRFNGFPQQLDAGIYWFGPDDQSEKATGYPSKFYDPSKPTMLYFHGWTGEGQGWTSRCKRLTTRCHPDICPNGGGQPLVNSWLDEGWNVGFFYWDQFADEACVRDAEQKLWFDKRGDGFRWKAYNLSSGVSYYQNYNEALDELSVADMCALNVKKAMGSFGGSQVRFVGHSLGAQLAVRCASMLHVEDHPAAPGRLSLLEPYFSKHSHLFFGCHGEVTTHEGMGDFAERLTVEYVQNMWKRKKVVTDVYKSSLLTEKAPEDSPYTELKNIVENGAVGGFEHTLVGNLGAGLVGEDLERASTLVEYEPDWCEGVKTDVSGDVEHLGCRHCAVMPLYLLSFGRRAPELSPPIRSAEPGSALSSCMTPSASCLDEQVREWVQRQLDMQPAHQSWKQTGGSNTFDGSDDSFILNPSIKQGIKLGLQSANSLVQLPVKREKPEDLTFTRVVTTPSLFLLAAVAIMCTVAGCVVVLLPVLHRRPDSDDESLATSRPYSRKDYNYKDPYNHKDPELGLGYENLLASPGGSFASSYSGQRIVLATPPGVASPGVTSPAVTSPGFARAVYTHVNRVS
ncbi:TTL1 [Symbiodinium sp. CCMP2456]|nr:TTL1 [Symbiodinium sp. CCMP2456]